MSYWVHKFCIICKQIICKCVSMCVCLCVCVRVLYFLLKHWVSWRCDHRGVEDYHGQLCYINEAWGMIHFMSSVLQNLPHCQSVLVLNNSNKPRLVKHTVSNSQKRGTGNEIWKIYGLEWNSEISNLTNCCKSKGRRSCSFLSLTVYSICLGRYWHSGYI